MEDGEPSLTGGVGQFGQSLLGRQVSFTKHDSHTLVPFVRVKSTLRAGSISASHFPQTSIGVSLIFFPQTSWRCLILATGLCTNSRLKTSNVPIASCIEFRSSLETCTPSDARARIASSAALTRSRSLVRLISKNGGSVLLPPLIFDHIGFLRKGCSRSLIGH